jgi:hypothetical protein
MSPFVGPIRRVDTAKSHYYVDGNKQRVPGVTTILSQGLPKAALINWAGKATAEYAVDHWNELTALEYSKRLKKLEGARYAERDSAANRGTEVHTRGEQLAQGEEIDVPDDIAGHVESYIQFLDEFRPSVILLEATVFSLRHGYAGTLDAVFQFDRPMPPHFPQEKPIILCDLKTNKSGIFGETALQLAGYRYADHYLDQDGAEQPMVEVDGCAAIHVRPDGYSLIPVIAGPQQLRDLLYAKEVRRFDSEARDLIGDPIVPPTRMRRRRLAIATDLEEVS